MHKLFFLALILIPFSVHASTELKLCMSEGNSYYECKQLIEKSVISLIKSDLVVRDGKKLVLKTVKKVNPDKVKVDPL